MEGNSVVNKKEAGWLRLGWVGMEKKDCHCPFNKSCQGLRKS